MRKILISIAAIPVRIITRKKLIRSFVRRKYFIALPHKEKKRTVKEVKI